MNASSKTNESFATRKQAVAGAELEKIDQLDPVLQHLETLNLPLTRENYLDILYPLGLPDNWGQEHEALLPRELRRIII